MKRQSKKIEYLKKHKISLIALSFAIVALILFAILFRNSKEQDKAQQALFKEREQLTDMAAYLDEISNVIDTNRERLAETALSQAGTSQTLATLSESLTLLDKDLAQIENRIEKQKETQAIESQKMAMAFSSLSETQREIREQIASLLSGLREENGSYFITAFEKLENIRKDNEGNYSSIADTLENLQEENEGNFAETLEKLETLQNGFDKIQTDTKSYYNDLTNAISLLEKESNMQHEELTGCLLAAKEDLSSLIENSFSNLDLRLDEDIAALMACFDTLHKQIADAELSISTLLDLMEQNSAERQGEINAAFASLNATMEQIQSDYGNAHMQIQQLIEKLQETENSNHKETLSTLAIMESNMTEHSLETFNRITNSLQTMGESLSSSINSMQDEFSQSFSNFNTEISGSMTDQINRLNTDIANQYQSLNSTITNQYQSLSTTVNNYDNSQQEALNNMLDMLNQKLQQVFQYVSNGKKLLASALLTKNVTIKEDATFNEIYNAILSIPQKIAIGVQEIPGTVTYDYHYHLNGSGNATHTESEAIKGGCYTMPVYHVHTGDSRNGGGCYTIPITHSHTESCYTVTKTVRRVTAKWFTGEGTGHACCKSGYGQNWARYTYVDEIYVNNELVSSVAGEGDLGYCCGICFERTAAEKAFTSTATDITCGYSEGVNGYNTGCGKNSHTIESYTPGCGLVDGQIIAAHIVYEQNALATANAAMLSIEPRQPEDISTISGNVPSDKNS